VSLVAVGAFDAVGSILVVAFFIIPPAAAYILTDRLSVMLVLSSLIGAGSAYLGYDLARGSLLGFDLARLITLLNLVAGSNLTERWNSSISASIVVMMFLFFLAAWFVSPRYGLIASVVRQSRDRRRFREQVLLGHVYHHEGEPDAENELAATTIHLHTHWTPERARQTLGTLRARGLVRIADGLIGLTDEGRETVERFRRTSIHRG
jgi:manganese/zinc/iron transport system permease protein